MFKSDNILIYMYFSKIIFLSSNTFLFYCQISLLPSGSQVRPAPFIINARGKIPKNRRKWQI